MTREREGLLFCLASAAGFAAMAIFAKYAYAEGANVVTVLAVRFVIAGLLLWALARARGAIGSARALIGGAVLGLLGYAAEAGLFFASLERLDASMAALVLYVYPALVLLGAVALRRDHVDRRRALALLASLSGVALVLAGGDIGSVDGLGLLMALGAAAGYAVYILGSDAVSKGASPLAFAASVCTGAANAFVLAGVVTGSLDLGQPLAVYGWILALALVSTVLAITAFLAGLQRLGPGRAAILSTVEPPITVALAAVCFGETLAPLQLLGGALVVGAVVLLQVPSPLARRGGARDSASTPSDGRVRRRHAEEAGPASA